MISLNQVQLQRGGKTLLNNAGMLIHAGQRVGVIGANGCGKSSIFELLLDRLAPDAGEVYLPKQLRVAHMAQEVAHSEQTALDYVLDGDDQLRATEQAIRDAEQKRENMALAAAYAQLDAIDGHSAPSRAQQLLHGLGFTSADEQSGVTSFSGGWRIRLSLARALMCPSDVLLLDEPTNHLDLDATIWLERWLLRYQGTLLLISHDRDFLDSVCTSIAHVERHEIHTYRGNYSAYEHQRAERLAQQQALYEKQQAQREQMQKFVNRFRAKATKARQAQSRLKALSKMEDIAPAHIDSPFNFHFITARKESAQLVNFKAASMGYPGTVVLNKVNLGILAGSRIGLLGPNGAGKSTLIKSIVGELPLVSGEKTEGANLKVGYFAQHQLEALDLHASPLLHLQRLSPEASEQSIRNFLGGFNFNGDMATGPIGHFSGGEKARLALAIVVWKKPNLLVMDEPTNHLDLEMRYALTVALQGFTGALILVSHDRHLIRNTVDQFLLVAHHKVDTFDGDLNDYQQWLANNLRDKTTGKPGEKAARQGDRIDKKELRKLAADRRAQIRPLKQKIAKAEKSLAKVQLALDEIETRLLDASIYDEDNKVALSLLIQEQGQLKSQAQLLEQSWLEMSEQLESHELQ